MPDITNLENYWLEYESGTIAQDSSSYSGDSTTVSGYTCPSCGQWVNSWECHWCAVWPSGTTHYHFPEENKTEQAFKILKKLVEKKVIREPQSFKKFCDLIEKIAEVI